MRISHNVMFTVNFVGETSNHRKIVTVITYYLTKNALHMYKIQFDVNVSNGVAIDVANDVLQVWWMVVYPFRVEPSKSLLHAEIK